MTSIAGGPVMHDFFAYVRLFFYMLKLVRHVLAGLFVLLLIGAGVIAIAEGMNYGKALYLTAITGLTVGYGDVAPATVVGRIVSVLIGLIGLIYFGIVVAVATSALRHLVEEMRDERKAAEQAERQAAKQEAEQPAEQPAKQP